MLSASRERRSSGEPLGPTPAHWHGTEPVRILAPDGSAVGDTDVGLDHDDLRAMLRWMLLARRLDRECIALQRQGELTVYPGFEGQEAAQIGSALALGPDDFVFPTFRELAAALVRGVDPVQYLAYHRGTWHGGPYDPRATRFGPICIPVATQIAHAVGYAMGLRARRLRACALAYFGDGSASEGDFHEAREPRGRVRRPGDPVLPEQRLGDQRADGAADGRRDLEASRGLRVPGRARGRQRRARGVSGDEGGERRGRTRATAPR